MDSSSEEVGDDPDGDSDDDGDDAADGPRERGILPLYSARMLRRKLRMSCRREPGPPLSAKRLGVSLLFIVSLPILVGGLVDWTRRDPVGLAAFPAPYNVEASR
jgi:hypothetical protein